MSEGMGTKKAEEKNTVETKKGFKAGFVAIIGRPNAGKSTLVNRLVGQKVAIVTSKPQTTRNRIQGIVTKPEGQIVFIDTPGLHEGTTALNRQMMREVAAALEGIDVLLLMVDASRTLPHADPLLIEKAERLQRADPPFIPQKARDGAESAKDAKGRPPKTILALNKIDRVPRPKLLPLLDAFGKAFPFAALVPISALKGSGCDALVKEIFKALPEAEAYFPEDQITDQPERFLAGELIREKAIQLTYHEVPHALAVIIDKYEEGPTLLKIHATLHVERDSQKKILIGHKGDMLKRVGTEARKELEKLLGTKIYLEMFVKVVADWRENPGKVRELDWHSQLEAIAEDQAARKKPEEEEEA